MARSWRDRWAGAGVEGVVGALEEARTETTAKGFHSGKPEVRYYSPSDQTTRHKPGQERAREQVRTYRI